MNWRFWKKPEPEVPEANPVVNAAYQVGWQNGYWSGVLKGRNDVIEALEFDLAARGKTLDELEPAHLRAVKVKGIH